VPDGLGALPPFLLPRGAGVDDRGGLLIQGIPVRELAERFATPLFVYDEDDVRARIAELAAALGGVRITYASKAFSAFAMARIVAETGLWWDAASGGELAVGLRGGVPAERIVLHGNNKSEEELDAALGVGVGRIVVDAPWEVEYLAAVGARRQPLWLRIVPGIEAHTHAFVRTGQVDTKFGLGLLDGTAERVLRAARAAGLRVVGIHAHIGSQIFDLEPFGELARVLGSLRAAWGLEEVSLGGGLGVAYVRDEHAPTLAAWGTFLLGALEANGIPQEQAFVEPGRALVAPAAVTLYRVGVVKRIPGVRTYVAVDGGMSDNPRPVLYGSGYEAAAAERLLAAHDTPMRVVGKHCESGDVLVEEALLPGDLARGELLVTPVTGAYGYAMGSTYNRLGRPAVVMVRDGAARTVVRREGIEDLVRLEVVE
jgi:diaminopimelate decarboxylase